MTQFRIALNQIQKNIEKVNSRKVNPSAKLTVFQRPHAVLKC